MQLVKEIGDTLEKGGFDYCLSEGCFDIAARREFTFFVKVLGNVDSLQESQATNLKVISRGFDAAVALIGLHTRRESLHDNVVYERFEIPTFTPGTLESIILNENFPYVCRSRGGFFKEIDPSMLRARREKAGLSQQQLADRVGVSKKSVYEHEHGQKKAVRDVVDKVEGIIGAVSMPIVLDFNYFAKGAPTHSFERQVSADLRRMGLSADVVHQSPFNIVAKESYTMLSRADESEKRLKRDAKRILQLSNLTRVPAFAVSREDISLEIPMVKERQLRKMSQKELKRLVK